MIRLILIAALVGGLVHVFGEPLRPRRSAKAARPKARKPRPKQPAARAAR